MNSNIVMGCPMSIIITCVFYFFSIILLLYSLKIRLGSRFKKNSDLPLTAKQFPECTAWDGSKMRCLIGQAQALSTLTWADKPPLLGGTIQELDLKTLRDLPTFKNVQYLVKSGLFIKDAHFSTLLKQSQSDLQNGVGYTSMTRQALEKASLKTSKKILLADVGEEMGVTAFAKKQIAEGSLLIYGGICGPIQKDRSHSIAMKVHGDFGVEAVEIRDLAAHFAHLPTESFVKNNLSFLSPYNQTRIAKANFMAVTIYLTDLRIMATALKATRTIEKDEILGFPYGDNAFPHLKAAPRYTEISGKLIPQLYEFCMVCVFHNELNVTFKTSWKDLQTRLLKFKSGEEGKKEIIVTCPEAQYAMVLGQSALIELMKNMGKAQATVQADFIINRECIKQVAAILSSTLCCAQQIYRLEKQGKSGWVMNLSDTEMMKMAALRLMIPFSAERFEHYSEKLNKAKMSQYYSLQDNNDFYFCFPIATCYAIAKQWSQVPPTPMLTTADRKTNASLAPASTLSTAPATMTASKSTLTSEDKKALKDPAPMVFSQSNPAQTSEQPTAPAFVKKKARRRHRKLLAARTS